MAINQPSGDAVQQRIAPYAGRTSLFLFGGATLIFANLLLSRQGWQVATALFPRLPASGPAGGTVTVLDLGLQILMLAALLLVASVSDEGGTLALVFLAALWLLFLYNHRQLFGASGSQSQASPARPQNPFQSL